MYMYIYIFLISSSMIYILYYRAFKKIMAKYAEVSGWTRLASNIAITPRTVSK